MAVIVNGGIHTAFLAGHLDDFVGFVLDGAQQIFVRAGVEALSVLDCLVGSGLNTIDLLVARQSTNIARFGTDKVSCSRRDLGAAQDCSGMTNGTITRRFLPLFVVFIFDDLLSFDAAGEVIMSQLDIVISEVVLPFLVGFEVVGNLVGNENKNQEPVFC